MSTQTGTVKWFNDAKGLLASSLRKAAALFAHFRKSRAKGFKSLAENQRVEFEVRPAKIAGGQHPPAVIDPTSATSIG